ncbi:MAG TPA: hypothetical protein VFZ21_30345 [Gemmatimonadaceae bacterium]|nr:hypothetical protein [Gemmatimonadaceae bacterium]
MLDYDGLRIVEDHPERHARPGVEKAVEDRTHERVDALVRDEGDVDPPRVLEAIGREVDCPVRPVAQADLHLPEVELGELAGHGTHSLRPVTE